MTDGRSKDSVRRGGYRAGGVAGERGDRAAVLRSVRSGGHAAALDALHPDIEYELTHFPDGQVYHGRDGVREAALRNPC
jgi:hypothetical protein